MGGGGGGEEGGREKRESEVSGVGKEDKKLCRLRYRCTTLLNVL